MNPKPFPSFTPRRHHRGFTLVEVLISIAIALVLILGISQIFSIAQRTTGAGTQVLADSETNRGIQQMLLNDARGVTNAVGDSPGLVILSYPQAAYRNRGDMQLDNDGDPRTINDPANPGKFVNELPFVIDDRIHRTDVFAFFTRGLFTRRTGDYSGNPSTNYPPSLTSATTSEEAFIWYGHLALPDSSLLQNWNYANPGVPTKSTGNYWNPGSGTAAANPNNFFASDWILGRQVMLLSPRSKINANYAEPHIHGTSDSANPLWLPIANPSTSNDPNSVPLYTSRYDLADATIAAYRSFLGSTSTTSWQGWTGWDINFPAETRFYANPFLQKAPSTSVNQFASLSAAIAQMSPIFVRGCTQFIVEFAGDYMTQDPTNNGNITSALPDGQIDYIDVVDATGKHTHQIRWYGFPRDTTGLGTPDILPVSTVLNNAGITVTPGAGPMRFERTPSASASSVTPLAPYNWTTNTTSTGNSPPYNGLPAYYVQPYICSWGGDTDASSAGNPIIPRPKMIRITIGIDDPTGHLNTQQIYQYVFNLP